MEYRPVRRQGQYLRPTFTGQLPAFAQGLVENGQIGRQDGKALDELRCVDPTLYFLLDEHAQAVHPRIDGAQI